MSRSIIHNVRLTTTNSNIAPCDPGQRLSWLGSLEHVLGCSDGGRVLLRNFGYRAWLLSWDTSRENALRRILVREWDSMARWTLVREGEFATAAIARLTRNSIHHLRAIDEFEDEDEELTKDRRATHARFTRAVYENMLTNIDRKGYEH